MRKLAINCEAKWIQKAEDTGYFLKKEECVAELMLEDFHLPMDTSFQPNAGNNTTNSTSCSWSEIMSQQFDFLNEDPLLQEIIEDAGHICLFHPKFH